LHVHNFALLEDAHAEFTAGFNVFTGETGAGKSILIDAFSMLLGGRASADYVRSGTDGLWVQAVFDITGQDDIKDILREQGLEADDELFLKRQVNASGKSRALVNGVQVPLTLLRRLGTLLVDIHGQHENQALLRPEAARLATDTFGSAQLRRALQSYQAEFAVYSEAK
jgi:DNA repair protein RecN (Recombination protein N)